jgi:hypothetical protein
LVPILGFIMAIINMETPIKIKSVFKIGFIAEIFGLSLSKLDLEKNNF